MAIRWIKARDQVTRTSNQMLGQSNVGGCASDRINARSNKERPMAWTAMVRATRSRAVRVMMSMLLAGMVHGCHECLRVGDQKGSPGHSFCVGDVNDEFLHGVSNRGKTIDAAEFSIKIFRVQAITHRRARLDGAKTHAETVDFSGHASK